MEEIFVMWQPVLNRESERSATLGCFLTELTVSLVPVDSVVLAQCLLERLNLKGEILRWQIKGCLTDYATPPEDTGSEKDKWRKAWTVEIEIAKVSPKELLLKHESLFLADPRIGEYKPPPAQTELPYLVVADFADEEDRAAYLDAVRKVLPPGSFEVAMATLSGQDLTVFQARLTIPAKHHGSIKRVEGECARHEGYTNFTKRADEADEAYNPAGVD